MDGLIYDNACTVEKRSSGVFKSGSDLALVIGQKNVPKHYPQLCNLK